MNSRQGSWFTVDVLVPSAFDRRVWCFIAEGSSSSETSSGQDGNFSKAQTHQCLKNSHRQVPHRNRKRHLTDDGWIRLLGRCWRGRLTLSRTQSLAVVYAACERYTVETNRNQWAESESELFKWFPAQIITSRFFFLSLITLLKWTVPQLRFRRRTSDLSPTSSDELNYFFFFFFFKAPWSSIEWLISWKRIKWLKRITWWWNFMMKPFQEFEPQCSACRLFRLRPVWWSSTESSERFTAYCWLTDISQQTSTQKENAITEMRKKNKTKQKILHHSSKMKTSCFVLKVFCFVACLRLGIV